jgi:hypothetical protein
MQDYTQMFVYHSSPDFGFVPFLMEKVYSQMCDANTENIFLPKFSKLLYSDSLNNPKNSESIMEVNLFKFPVTLPVSQIQLKTAK